MRVQITIPQPKTKRLQGTGQLKVFGGCGWGGDALLHNQALEAETTLVEIEVPAVYQQHFKPVCDGHTLHATVVYQNANGSRTERYKCDVALAPVASSS